MLEQDNARLELLFWELQGRESLIRDNAELDRKLNTLCMVWED